MRYSSYYNAEDTYTAEDVAGLGGPRLSDFLADAVKKVESLEEQLARARSNMHLLTAEAVARLPQKLAGLVVLSADDGVVVTVAGNETSRDFTFIRSMRVRDLERPVVEAEVVVDQAEP